jgi:hypothetical protein
MRVVLRVGGRVALPIYNVYGFPGGHHSKEAAGRTNAVLEAVVQEATHMGDLYAAIVGDLNADTEDLPALGELIRGQGWTDLGAHLEWLVGGSPVPTCFVAGHEGTKRDFILVDAYLMTMAPSYSVADEETFPVHRPVRMDVGHQQQHCYVYKAVAPADPCGALRCGLDSEEGDKEFRRAQEDAFQAAEQGLTAAALLRDTNALFGLWSRTLEKAYAACLDPEQREAMGTSSFCGRGCVSVRKARLCPPAPRLVGADQVAEIFQSNPAAHARRLARAVRGLWARLTRTSRKATRTGSRRRPGRPRGAFLTSLRWYLIA